MTKKEKKMKLKDIKLNSAKNVYASVKCVSNGEIFEFCNKTKLKEYSNYDVLSIDYLALGDMTIIIKKD